MDIQNSHIVYIDATQYLNFRKRITPLNIRNTHDRQMKEKVLHAFLSTCGNRSKREAELFIDGWIDFGCIAFSREEGQRKLKESEQFLIIYDKPKSSQSGITHWIHRLATHLKERSSLTRYIRRR